MRHTPYLIAMVENLAPPIARMSSKACRPYQRAPARRGPAARRWRDSSSRGSAAALCSMTKSTALACSLTWHHGGSIAPLRALTGGAAGLPHAFSNQRWRRERERGRERLTSGPTC